MSDYQITPSVLNLSLTNGAIVSSTPATLERSNPSSTLMGRSARVIPPGESVNYPAANISLQTIAKTLVEDGLTDSSLDKYFWRPIINILDYFSGTKTDTALKPQIEQRDVEKKFWNSAWEIGVEFSPPEMVKVEYRTRLDMTLNDREIDRETANCVFEHIFPPHNNSLTGLDPDAMYDKCELKQFPPQPSALDSYCGSPLFSIVECALCSALPSISPPSPFEFPSNWSWCINNSSSWSIQNADDLSTCLEFPGIRFDLLATPLRKDPIHDYPMIGLPPYKILIGPCKMGIQRYLEAITPEMFKVCYQDDVVRRFKISDCSGSILPLEPSELDINSKPDYNTHNGLMIVSLIGMVVMVGHWCKIKQNADRLQRRNNPEITV